MRQSLTAIAALTAAVVLSSCSTSEDTPAAAASPDPVKTVTVTATPESSPTPQPTSMEEVYLAKLRETHASLITAPDDSLLGIGEGVCDIYDLGNTSDDVNNFLAISAGVAYTLREFASMHGAAVAALCPEHLETLQGSGQE